MTPDMLILNVNVNLKNKMFLLLYNPFRVSGNTLRFLFFLRANEKLTCVNFVSTGQSCNKHMIVMENDAVLWVKAAVKKKILGH